MSLLDSAGLVNADIWCNGVFSFESPLKDLLEGEYTLEQLLGEDELLQELHGVHPQLIEFFSSEETVAGLIRYVILPPKVSASSAHDEGGLDDAGSNGKGDTEDNVIVEENFKKLGEEKNVRIEKEVEKEEDKVQQTVKEPGKWLERGISEDHDHCITQQTKDEEAHATNVRYPYMACEVICCEIKGVIDIIVDGFVPPSMDEDETAKKYDTKQTRLLDLLFSILFDSKPGGIDDYRGGYFEKVLSVLFRNRPKDIAQYLNDGGGKGSAILMSALFKHLYSHSLMQIVQRVLLPHNPSPPQKIEAIEDSNECEDLFNNTLDGADMDPFDLFRCDWSESKVALQMILDYLIGSKATDILSYGDDELVLNFYQNASEVLVTIIQNSPLNSHTLHILTTDPIMEKIVVAATYVEKGTHFSCHDSRLTCAMNVLESLILQLGGYGTVGTIVYPEEENTEGERGVIDETVEDESMSKTEEVQTNIQQISSTSGIQDYATSETLIRHLPTVLASLGDLLLYSGTEKWVSPMQFSRDKPQQILGASRLRIIRLLESLVLLGNQDIDSLLCETSCLEICLDLFWKFQWCSMLHQSVANLLVHVFEGKNTRIELQSYFLLKCNLLGRLMYSFWDKADERIVSIVNESNAEVYEFLLAMKDSDNPPAVSPSSVASEKGSVDGVLPVSDDDVDAAMEQQQLSVNAIDLEGPKYSDDSNGNELEFNPAEERHSAESFRLGYMGHVIIICQALVHACIEDSRGDSESTDPDKQTKTISSEEDNLEDNKQTNARIESNEQDKYLENLPMSNEDDFIPNVNAPPNSLILAKLVNTHPLGRIWHDFVSTTLASETALQTTPLGGFQDPIVGNGIFDMQRPGPAYDGGYDDDDDDTEAPPVPQRGLMVDGDVIDMDENDLDVAACMMADLSLGQVADDRENNQRNHNGTLEGQSNAFHQNGYIFDDPLGCGRFADFDEDNQCNSGCSDDNKSEVSSDTKITSNIEASDNVCKNTPETGAPIMDLFAGNFDGFGNIDNGDQQPSSNWSDFANFDDAFAAAQLAEESSHAEPRMEKKNDLDEIFGEVKARNILLDNLEQSSAFDNGTLSNDAGVDAKAESGGQQ